MLEHLEAENVDGEAGVAQVLGDAFRGIVQLGGNDDDLVRLVPLVFFQLGVEPLLERLGQIAPRR